LVVIDCGTGAHDLGRSLLAEARGPLRGSILFSHTHWDHIQGLPFFLPVYKEQNHLRILGYEGARHGLANILTSQMESPFFPIGLKEVPANVKIEELKEKSFNIGSVRVDSCMANHPGVCAGYRLSTAGGSIAFFPIVLILLGVMVAVNWRRRHAAAMAVLNSESPESSWTAADLLPRSAYSHRVTAKELAQHTKGV